MQVVGGASGRAGWAWPGPTAGGLGLVGSHLACDGAQFTAVPTGDRPKQRIGDLYLAEGLPALPRTGLCFSNRHEAAGAPQQQPPPNPAKYRRGEHHGEKKQMLVAPHLARTMCAQNDTAPSPNSQSVASRAAASPAGFAEPAHALLLTPDRMRSCRQDDDGPLSNPHGLCQPHGAVVQAGLRPRRRQQVGCAGGEQPGPAVPLRGARAGRAEQGAPAGGRPPHKVGRVSRGSTRSRKLRPRWLLRSRRANGPPRRADAAERRGGRHRRAARPPAKLDARRSGRGARRRRR